MKKIAFIIVLLIVVINSISAQFVVGPKVGLNISKEYFGEKFIDEDVKFKTGLNVGVFGKYDVSNKFDIQTELLYSQQGLKVNIPLADYGGTMIEGYKVSTHYLNIPVLLKYYPFKRIYIEAGPQVGFCLDSKLSHEYSNGISLDYSTTDFSLAGGIGINIGHGLCVNARYNHGFTRTIFNTDWKNRVIQLSLTYDLWRF